MYIGGGIPFAIIGAVVGGLAIQAIKQENRPEEYYKHIFSDAKTGLAAGILLPATPLFAKFGLL